MRSRIAGSTMHLVFPESLAGASLPLMQSERAEFEAVFGAPVAFVNRVPTDGPCWIVEVQSTADHNSLRWDSETATLTSVVCDPGGFGATLQMLHSLVALGVDFLTDEITEDLPSATSRLVRELAGGFPGFEIRHLSSADLPSGDSLPVNMSDVERMVALLQDAHTTVRRSLPVYHPPYAVSLSSDQAVLRRVEKGSAAYEAGVRAGWNLDIADRQSWLDRTGAPPHVHDLVAGRRAIAIQGERERMFTAHSPSGASVSWDEAVVGATLDSLMTHSVVAGYIVYVRLRNWIAGVGIEEQFLEIVQSYQPGQTMVLDLRGNTGGNLMMAKQIRRMFLRERTLLGTIKFTRGDGTLADSVYLWDEPCTTAIWPGDLVVLTDGLTYSASEDFLHGLQGLSHVTVVGHPSGGGSGRPRTVPLTPGWHVTISTALTFDRTGRCIEGQGIPVDVLADPFVDDWRVMLNSLGLRLV